MITTKFLSFIYDYGLGGVKFLLLITISSTISSLFDLRLSIALRTVYAFASFPKSTCEKRYDK